MAQTTDGVHSWTPGKPEVRPGAREESASAAWLTAHAMNVRDTENMYTYRHWTLDVDRHYVKSVTATTNQGKVIITLQLIPSKGTVLQALHG